MRLAVVGLGTVGSWLLRAVEGGEAGDVEVVLRTSGRDGGEAELADAQFDVLAETVNSPDDGEPGLSFMRDALARGIHVVTSDKWPVALHGVELAATARKRGVSFRAESTVMSGTPVLAPLREELTGTEPASVRGVVNATVNQMLTEMAKGATYDDALAQAQADGLAEPDPSADVDGRDECAKAMVLAALVFGEQVTPGDVAGAGDQLAGPRRGGSAAQRRGGALGDDAVAVGLRCAQRERRAGGAGRRRPAWRGRWGGEPARGGDAGGRGAQLQRPGAGPEIAGLGVLNDLKAVTGA